MNRKRREVDDNVNYIIDHYLKKIEEKVERL